MHRLAHFLGTYSAERIEWWAHCDKLMAAYKCKRCDKLTGIHPVGEGALK